MGLVTKVNRAYHRDPVAAGYRERAVALYTRVGGAEIRPTRAFLWLGRRDSGRERIFALGRAPRPLRTAKRHHFDFGSWGVSVLGNPAVTVGQFTYFFVRRR